MNVSELIKLLESVDPEALVVTVDCCYGPDLLQPDGIEVKVMRTYTNTYVPTDIRQTMVADIIDEDFDLDPEGYPDVKKVNTVVLR